MDSQQTKRLFDAVKNDNLNEFQSLILSNSDLNICFGRFPLLSVCYLYKSYKILDKYEKNMLGVKTYTIVSEYYEIYLLFKKYAKKSIRFFLNNKIVEPIQMLAVLDEREKIAKQYNNFYKNDEIVQKIEKIYSVTNSERVVATNEKFEAPRKKRGLKQQIYISAVAIILCLFMIFPIISIVVISNNSGLGIKSNPINITSKKEFVKALSGGKNNYTLQCDIYLDRPLYLEKFSGNLNGNNHKIILTEEYAEYVSENFNRPLIENLIGTIKNLEIQINKQNLKITQNTSFFTENLTGNIENCKISGLIDAKFDTTTDTYLSLFAIVNDGKIINSIADVSVVATNNSSHNAFLTAFVGVNNGEIDNCKSEAEPFIADTVDSACFAMDNFGIIKNVENNLEIYQSSAKDWYPNTAGIVIGNNGTIINSKNNGAITSISTNEKLTASDGNRFVVYASGISVNNYGTIENCQNNGEILAQSINAEIFSAGIVAYNLFNIKEENYVFDFTQIGSVKNCTNTGNVSGVSTGQSLENIAVYCSGVVALNNTNVEGSKNTGDIYVNSISSFVFAGGIVAYNNYNNYNYYLERKVIDSKSSCNIRVSSGEKEANIGGLVGYGYAMNISNSGFDGEIIVDAKISNVGGILGSTYVSTLISSYSGAKIINNNDEVGNDVKINIAMLVGLYVTNQSTINVGQNKCILSETYPALNWKYNNSTIINSSTAEQSGTTVYNTVEELLESLVA